MRGGANGGDGVVTQGGNGGKESKEQLLFWVSIMIAHSQLVPAPDQPSSRHTQQCAAAAVLKLTFLPQAYSTFARRSTNSSAAAWSAGMSCVRISCSSCPSTLRST